jgi:hypothetical protein
MQSKDATKDFVPTPSDPMSPPMAVSRPRNGAQGRLDGDPDPLKTGEAGRGDVNPSGLRLPAQPGNPWGGEPFGRRP